jgi:FkbM family methyltransferase
VLVNGAIALRNVLEELLSEPLSLALEREHTTFDRAVAQFHRRLVLAGAGNLGRKALSALKADGIVPLAFVDNNPALWGTSIEGIPVMAPAEGARIFGQSATFCITIWRGEGTDTMAQRRQPLLDAGCAHVIDFGSMFWKYGATLLPHYSLDSPHRVLEAAVDVRAGFDVWQDQASRAEYVAQVRWRLWLDFDNLPPPVKEPIYFPSDLIRIGVNEVFVDCGAYDGDTVRDFIGHSGGHFRSIYAFEADQKNFAKLKNFVDSLPGDLRARVMPVDVALSDRAGFLHFAETGTAGSAVSREGVRVKSAALDEVVAEPPTWIKMDIEGSEPAALRGARKLISANAPILSICVYHSQSHLWSIPLQIMSMHSSYKLYLRPFVPESWDLVCYAIPNDRLLT